MTEGSATGLRFVNITTSGVLSGNTSQVYAIKNPLAFVTTLINPYDWYTDNSVYQDNTLWGDGEEKSAYDPCPHEWKVPTDSELTYGDFSVTIMPASGSDYMVYAGRIYNQMAWYPAAGRRRYTRGVLYAVSTYGYYWSSSASGTNAKNLRFTMSAVDSSATNSRAYGISVRCVQE